MLIDPNNSHATRVLAVALFALAVCAQTFSFSRAQAAIADSWDWPVPAPWRIERAYEPPATPYGVGHRGIDLVAPRGTPVYAPAAGVVLFAGTVVDRGVVSIDHGDAVTSSFEPVTPAVLAGETVKVGQIIGHTGEGSHCECLHLGARIKGNYVSPLAFLSAIDRAVLLPWQQW